MCDGNIPAFELVMKVRGHNLHLECFKCHECSHRSVALHGFLLSTSCVILSNQNNRFCVGDKFYLYQESKILCKYHYEERMVFASLAHESLEQIKDRTTHDFLDSGSGGSSGCASDAASSGYGSHTEQSPFPEQR